MLFQVLDYLGVAVFAFSGAVVASRKRLDFIAFLFFATLTGIGGGTLRDLILGVPVFWVGGDGYLIVCFCVSVFVWFFGGFVERLGKPLRWADAVGLSAYSVMGAAKALSVGDAVFVAVLMGVATATFGGVLRDVIARESSAIIKPEIYVSAAFVGAGTYVALFSVGAGGWISALVGGALALSLRGGAIQRGWRLPGHKPIRQIHRQD
ncbi:putative membrane protein YeiH [Roseibium hamelinense]|uniref:Putative membrane protein YeiH n=1 Tax=Roseibium hamelinense TaxID=150831 RepID=A0A562T2V8_9HYPH|nr:trimeric intracellular cation channel family protein [Roseibium hamelinense]MTI44560.1 trimeric intracellular cation channel family protein [Roseibium hamelinense]TWI87186.1 putative membrane protein YeiH [Roseibium hamelinense]